MRRIWRSNLRLKAFVPVVAMSEDKKLTSTNVPWIFRTAGIDYARGGDAAD